MIAPFHPASRNECDGREYPLPPPGGGYKKQALLAYSWEGTFGSVYVCVYIGMQHPCHFLLPLIKFDY